MAWRFRPSKYKNTTSKVPKKEDTIYDVPVGTLSNTNNGIESSSSLLAFCVEAEGGKLGVVPINSRGRRLRDDLSIVCAHSNGIGDFCFAPFDDRLLMTCSRDEELKLWRFDDENANLPSSLSNPTSKMSIGKGRLSECLSVHPTAASILAVAAGNGAVIVDLNRMEIAMEVTEAEEKVQWASWSGDGKNLGLISDKGRKGYLYDPRASQLPHSSISLHSGMGRESRILYLGETGKLLSSGFTTKRNQQIRIFDTRNFSEPLHMEELASSTGALLPFYDPDTSLIFLAGKGSNKLIIGELQDRSPSFLFVYQQNLSEQILGGCLSSKSTLDVMQGEVQRFFQLSRNAILPYQCFVPRRSYRDFHEDLYPLTVGNLPGCSADEWLKGCDKMPPKFSLNPSESSRFNQILNGIEPEKVVENGKTAPPVDVSTLDEFLEPVIPDTSTHTEPEYSQPKEQAKIFAPITKTEIIRNGNGVEEVSSVKSVFIENSVKQLAVGFDGEKPKKPLSSESKPTIKAEESKKYEAKPAPIVFRKSIMNPINVRDRPRSCIAGIVQSKFRHAETHLMNRKNMFFNLRNLNTRLPPEGNGFAISAKWAAVSLSGPGGVIAIFDLAKPQKLPDGLIPGLQNRANVTDLVWCPFDQDQLAVGCDNGFVNIWQIPSSGVEDLELEPANSFKVCSEKIVTIRYHPLATDILAVAANDLAISIWDLIEKVPKVRLSGHHMPILSISWSSNGQKLASLARDAMLRVFEPQQGDSSLISQSKVLESTRGGRISFACDDRIILVVHFNRSSSRQVSLYKSDDLSHLHTATIDASPQPLIPIYDYDTSVLTLSGKGDRMIHLYEVGATEPYLLPLAPFTAPNVHQSLSIQQKHLCDIRSVEFQRGWRLTEKTIEFLCFKVPRLKKNLFQNDLFPDALVTWIPVLTAREWFSGGRRQPEFQSLKPDGMENLISNSASVEATLPAPIKATRLKPGIIMETKRKVEASWSNRIAVDERLEQDLMDGVAEEEWIDEV